MKVEDIITAKGDRVATLEADVTIAQAAMLLSRERIGAVVVCTGQGRVEGVLSERDIVQGLADHGEGVLSMTIRSLMRGNVITCRHDDTLLQVMALMTDRRVRHLPVIDHAGTLCGIISIGDAVKSRIAEVESEATALREYITMA